MTKSKEILEAIIRSIVDNQSAVSIDEKSDEMGVLLTLHVDKTDMGKVIGKAGETAKAIRSIVKIIGIREKSRVSMIIAEPEGGSRVASAYRELRHSLNN